MKTLFAALLTFITSTAFAGGGSVQSTSSPDAISATSGGTFNPGAITYGLQASSESLVNGSTGLQDNGDIPLCNGASCSNPTRPIWAQPNLSIIDNMDGVKYAMVRGGGSTCILNKDASDHFISSQAYTLQSNGDGAACTAKITGISPTINMKNMQYGFDVKIDSYNNCSSGTAYFSSDNLSANFIICDFASCGSGQTYKTFSGTTDKWTAITGSQANCTVTGTPDMSAINSFQLRMVDKTGGAGNGITTHMNGMGIFQEPPQCVVTNSFDNGNYSQLSTAAWTMAQYGWRGSLYITPADLALSSSWLSISSVAVLAQQYDWEVGLHPTANFMDNESTTTAREILVRGFQVLRDNGIPTLGGVAIPHGAFTEGTKLVLRQESAYARSIITGNWTSGQTDIETFPPADPWLIKSRSVDSGDTLTTLQSAVNHCIAHPGMLNLTWHDFPSPVSAQTDVLPTTFQNFFIWLSTQNVKVLPLGEALALPRPGDTISPGGITIGLNSSGNAKVAANNGPITVSTSPSSGGTTNITVNASGQTTFTPNLSSNTVSAALSGTFANTIAGTCIAGSSVTITLPTNNDKIMLGLTATIGVNALNATIGINVLQDGAFMSGYTNVKGLVSPLEAVSGDGTNVSFAIPITGLTAAQHTYCFTPWVSSGTGTIDSTNSVAKFWVYALP